MKGSNDTTAAEAAKAARARGGRAVDGGKPSRLWLGGILILAGALVLWKIGEKSLWYDEAVSVSLARLPLDRLWELISGYQANQGIYYVILHFWTAIGHGEAAVRALSAVAAVAAIPFLFGIGNRLFSREVALAACLLLAVNAFFVQYAQEARAYSFVLLLVTASTYFFVRALDDSSRWRWAAYAVTGAGAVYMHFFSGLVLLSHLVSLFFFDRRKIEWARVGMAYGAILVLVSPALLLIATGAGSHINWIKELSPGGIYKVMRELAGQGGRNAQSPMLLMAYLGAIAAAVIGHRAHRSGEPAFDRWRNALVIGLWIIPIAVTIGASFIKPIFISRYLIVALPGMVLLAAAGVVALRPRWAAAAALFVLVALAANGLRWWYLEYEKEDWRGATRHVVEHAEPDDGVVFYFGRMRTPFEYYVEEFDVADEAPMPVLPDHAWGESGTLSYSVTDLEDALGRIEGRHERLWLVTSHAGAGQTGTVRDVLEEGFSQQGSATFPFVKVFLYDRK